MKFVYGICTIVFLLFYTGCAKAFEFVEGVHYKTVQSSEIKYSGQPIIKEYFSLFCPSCRSVEHIMPQIKKSLPNGMVFERVHVDFLPGVNNELQQFVTGAYYLARLKGKGEAFVQKTFSHIHDLRKPIQNKNDIISLLVASGLGEKEAREDLLSKEVAFIVNDLHEEQRTFSMSGDLNGVPTFIVNYRYVIVLSSLDKSAPLAHFKSLIEHLNDKV